MTPLLEPAAAPSVGELLAAVEARAARRAFSVETLGSRVPGIPGDGTEKTLAVDAEHGLVFTWVDRSPERQHEAPRRSGYETALLRVVHEATGRWVGWLSVSYTTRELVESLFPGRFGPLRWAEENLGAMFGFGLTEAGLGSEPTAPELWAAAHRYLGRTPTSAAGAGGSRTPMSPLSLLNLSAADAPADAAILGADLDVCLVAYRTVMERFVTLNAIPFVAYAHVDGEHEADQALAQGHGHPGSLRGSGVGSRMYVLAAQQLAETGRVLMASFTQTPQARRVWDRFCADASVPTREIQVPEGWRTDGAATRAARVLDYHTGT